MKSHELFQRMPPELAAEIFMFLHREEKPVYKAAIQGLANQRNLRPVFVERKPPPERFVWLKAALSRPVSNTLATHLIQAWLLGANKPMLCDFLAALGVAHEADGTVEELPPEPPKEKIAKAVDDMLTRYPADKVAVYLHAFRDMDTTVQWSALNDILAGRAELQLGDPAAGTTAS